MSTPTTDQPQPSPEVREAMRTAYDRAAATHPEACATRVIDAKGGCITLTETECARRKAARWPSGALPPPM
jgi:hypothetical protein